MAEIPGHLRIAIDAAAAAVGQARRGTREAQLVENDLMGLSYLALRHQGLTEDYAARTLGVPLGELRAHARAAGLLGGPEDAERRAAVEQLWDAARAQASDWVESTSVTLSWEAITANNIDDISYPLPIGSLDCCAAEFAHQRTGEKIVVYCPVRWKGTPAVVDGGPPRWDYQGRYRIEFIAAAGERGSVRPASLGLTDADLDFDTSERRDRHDVTFDRIVTAVRRRYAILAPFSITALEWLSHT